MRSHVFAIDLLLRDTILIDAHCSKNSLRTWIYLCTTIADDTNNDLLPRILSPGIAVITRVHVFNVLNHTTHGPSEELIFLIVHGYDDEKLSMARLCEKSLAQCEAFFIKLGRIASGRRISHVRKLIAPWSLYMRYLIQKTRRNRTIQNKIAVD